MATQEYSLVTKECKKYTSEFKRLPQSIDKLIEGREDQRITALNELNNICLQVKKILANKEILMKYPNLDFISNFGKYFNFNKPELCKLLMEGKYLGGGKAGIAYIIKIGNKDYIIKRINVDKIDEYLSIKIHNTQYNNQYLINNPCVQFNQHQFKYFNDIFNGHISAVGNNFSNQTCMHMILSNILDSFSNMKNNYIHQYDAFYCQDTKTSTILGCNITTLANKGDLSEYIEKLSSDNINDTFISDVLQQLLRPLGCLKCKKYGFLHADLKCRNVFVYQDPQNQKVYYQLADFDKSSIYWKGIRFHTRLSPTLRKLTGLIKKIIGDIYDSTGGEYYLSRLIPDNIQTMFSSKPIYMSFDVYTFIYSLLREPKIFEQYQQNKLSLFDKVLRILFPNNEHLQNIIGNIIPKYNKYIQNQKLIEQYRETIKQLNKKIEYIQTFLNVRKNNKNDPKIMELLRLIESTEIPLPSDYRPEDYQNIDIRNNSSIDEYLLIKPLLSQKLESLMKPLIYLRSISGIMADLQVPLKIDINLLYHLFDLQSPGDIDRQIDIQHTHHSYILELAGNEGRSLTSGEYHVCTLPCENGQCSTNKYSAIYVTGNYTMETGKC